MLPNLNNYGVYQELAKTGFQQIYTDDINRGNIESHFRAIISIMDDGIDEAEVQNMKIEVVFPDDTVGLYIVQYMYNLMFWNLIVANGAKIQSTDLFFEKVISKGSIKSYIDRHYIRKAIKEMAQTQLYNANDDFQEKIDNDIITMNQTIDNSITKFRALRNYQMWLANTVNFEDTIALMRKYPEFEETMRLDISDVPLEDVKEVGMKATNTQIEYIMKSDEDHCSKYSFLAGEGINKGQFKEVDANIGTKPMQNANGATAGVFPRPINHSFINGGLQTVEDIIMDSSMGRIAQILSKQNVGQSGSFARRLGLNNQSALLHPDPSYSCDTKNFEMVNIKSKDILSAYDLRFYRFRPDGPEYLLDALKDSALIGKVLYFRSPMTCSSAAKGYGVCYRCYGILAFVNSNINIGQIAAEQLSSVYTQTLLSAKHLLASSIIRLRWCPEFKEYFNVEYDQIILKEDIDYRKMKLIISADDIIENELDEDGDGSETMEEQNCVYNFTIVRPDGSSVIIRTEDSDSIYIHADLQAMMDEVGENDDGIYEFNMAKLKDMSLFTVEVRNDELSKTMKRVKNLIDSKGAIKNHSRNSILEAFIDSNISGGIKINAVHFEVILMSQMRSAESILEMPDWNLTDAPYQIITLEDSLINNQSITVRLQASKIKKTLTSPTNRLLHSPGNFDLYYMTKPQTMMNQELIDSKSLIATERKIISPVYFESDHPDTGSKYKDTK